MVKTCSKRNPKPPCNNDYTSRINKWGNTCCYKTKKYIRGICSKRNPKPPCISGYYSKKM